VFGHRHSIDDGPVYPSSCKNKYDHSSPTMVHIWCILLPSNVMSKGTPHYIFYWHLSIFLSTHHFHSKNYHSNIERKNQDTSMRKKSKQVKWYYYMNKNLVKSNIKSCFLQLPIHSLCPSLLFKPQTYTYEFVMSSDCSIVVEKIKHCIELSLFYF
jgi:hypothetical protein